MELLEFNFNNPTLMGNFSFNCQFFAFATYIQIGCSGIIINIFLGKKIP